jgi:hypothetical protein
MQINWKVGLTRLFAVLWGIWLLLVLFFVVSFATSLALLPFKIIALWGIAVPGALFLTLRWLFAGFAGGKSS